MAARRVGLFLLLAAAWPAAAQHVVTSPGPEAVSVTIYRNPNAGRNMDLEWLGGYAFITETRTVSLPAGESVIRFEGVAGNILPASAIVRNLPRQPAEKNHDARLLSAGALVDAFLGRQVHIRRTNPATGRTTESEAIIRSGPDGIVLQTPEGIESLRCSGLPETLVYSEVAPGLSDKPTLAVTTSSAEAVTATVSLSYLAGQFDWRANYVANIAPDGRTLDLFAWLTLANANDESFVGASAQAVAGEPNREDEEEDENRAEPLSPEIRLRCWPSGTTSDTSYQAVPPGVTAEDYSEGDIIVTGSRVAMPNLVSTSPVTVITAQLEQLGDLKLYRIPEPVTVAANAQKQVALLHKERVRFERLYGLRLNAVAWIDEDEGAARTPASILLRTRNIEKRGLGVPLPSGVVAVFEEASGRPMLAGEVLMYDTPVGEDVELLVGSSSDVAATQRILPRPKAADDDDDDDYPRDYEIVLTNASPSAADVEVRLRVDDGDERLTGPSRKLGRRNGSPLWRARVPARGRARLTYTIERQPVRDLDEDD
ncbi:MAG TPA: hypothetical protein VF605_07620 [Allosphingosinicella sp.]